MGRYQLDAMDSMARADLTEVNVLLGAMSNDLDAQGVELASLSNDFYSFSNDEGVIWE